MRSKKILEVWLEDAFGDEEVEDLYQIRDLRTMGELLQRGAAAHSVLSYLRPVDYYKSYLAERKRKLKTAQLPGERR